MNYLGRPVFEFAIDWSKSVNKDFAYDAEPLTLGFGAMSFTGLQRYTTQGYAATVQLRGAVEIDGFDAFTAALVGRLIGFWFPAPFEGMRVVNVVDTTHFDVPAQGLTDTWEDNPDVYLFFLEAGHASVPAKITAVVDLGTGRERVTINAAVAFLSVNTIVRRLNYARLADDVEKSRFIAEGWQERDVRVIELPLEYAAAETGQRPVYLYHLWFEAPIGAHWRFTSFALDVASGGELYQAAGHGANAGITHGARINGVRGDDSLELRAAWHASNPLALYFPVPIPAALNVQVLEAPYADPDASTPIFTGRVLTVRDDGEKLIAKCDTFGTILRGKFPRPMVHDTCNNYLFDFGCKLSPAFWIRTAAVVSVNAAAYPPSAVVVLHLPTDAMKEPNFFAQGWIEVGTGTDFEVRTVIASIYDLDTDELTLTLNLGLLHAEAGDVMLVAPGCDGSVDRCTATFANFINFGGFPNLPTRNLSLTALDLSTNEGGKK